MQYTIILSPQEIDTIAKILQEWPYRIVQPILENMAKQVDLQQVDIKNKE